MSGRAALAAALLLGAALLSGCMEVEQSAGPSAKTGRYQGKPDTPPWSNAPLANGPQWTAGDQASWSKEIGNRQYVQNEYRRIEH